MESMPRHQCLIYEKSPSEHLMALARSVKASLRGNYRCLYLNSPPMVAGMRCSLAAEGVDPAAAIERGALILSSEQDHLSNGLFDVELMLQTLQIAVAQAIADGYKGLWASGDITWELGGEINFDKLLEYEQRLDQFMQKNESLMGVCQYHRKTLPLQAVTTGLVSHPAIYLNETLSYLNPRYEPRTA